MGSPSEVPSLPDPPGRFGRGEVQVWYEYLHTSLDAYEEYVRLLSTEEQLRAERFRSQVDRTLFAQTRARLRCLLAGYLEEAPDKIALQLGIGGKPLLGPPFSDCGLRFNVSHTAGLSLLAFAWDQEIGVDVERRQPLDDIDDLASLVYANGEIALLNAAPSSERADLFLRMWTRKEAWLKAVGTGLLAPLQDIDLSFLESPRGEPAAVASEGAAAGWTVTDLRSPEGYTAALAVSGPLASINYKAL